MALYLLHGGFRGRKQRSSYVSFLEKRVMRAKLVHPATEICMYRRKNAYPFKYSEVFAAPITIRVTSQQRKNQTISSEILETITIKKAVELRNSVL